MGVKPRIQGIELRSNDYVIEKKNLLQLTITPSEIALNINSERLSAELVE